MPASSTLRFIESPNVGTIDAIAVSRPYSPFAGRQYVNAMRALGLTPVAIIEQTKKDDMVACMGFLRGEHGLAKLTIPSTPRFSDNEEFWTLMRRFANNFGVAEIEAQSFASVATSKPDVGKYVTVTPRHEHLISLASPDMDAMLSKGHKRSLNRANKQGLTLTQSDNKEAVDTHCALALGSLTRQATRQRGVNTTLNQRLIRALVESGCATVWQAWKEDSCHSSVVTLCNEYTAYYYSAGNSSAGLDSRASVWLVTSIAQRIFESGLKIFNLGGTSPGETGLQQFKSGFGAEEIALLNTRVKLLTGPDRIFRKGRAKLQRFLKR